MTGLGFLHFDSRPGLVARCDVPTGLHEVIDDPKGWLLHFHSPRVLDQKPSFKGAVWTSAGGGDGAVLFHNSVFSNWYPRPFRLMHAGEVMEFGNSEGVIMAVKERVATGQRLNQCLKKHSQLGPEESKQAAAASGNAFPLWGDHAFQVLLGASACLVKFSQNADLRDFLLSTGDAVLVESAPNDGAWGVAKNSRDFLDAGERPEDYTLQSTTESEISFSTGTWSGSRRRNEANALGKALTLVRSVLRRWAEIDEAEHVALDLPGALQEVWQELYSIPGGRLDRSKEAYSELMCLLEA